MDRGNSRCVKGRKTFRFGLRLIPKESREEGTSVLSPLIGPDDVRLVFVLSILDDWLGI